MPIVNFVRAVRRRAARIANFAPGLTPDEASMLSRLKGVRDADLAAPTPLSSYWTCPDCLTRNNLQRAECGGCSYTLRKPAVLR